jgi:hypothetical protein
MGEDASTGNDLSQWYLENQQFISLLDGNVPF